jgi:hypothetical protein
MKIFPRRAALAWGGSWQYAHCVQYPEVHNPEADNLPSADVAIAAAQPSDARLMRAADKRSADFNIVRLDSFQWFKQTSPGGLMSIKVSLLRRVLHFSLL